MQRFAKRTDVISSAGLIFIVAWRLIHNFSGSAYTGDATSSITDLAIIPMFYFALWGRRRTTPEWLKDLVPNLIYALVIVTGFTLLTMAGLLLIGPVHLPFSSLVISDVLFAGIGVCAMVGFAKAATSR